MVSACIGGRKGDKEKMYRQLKTAAVFLLIGVGFFVCYAHLQNLEGRLQITEAQLELLQHNSITYETSVKGKTDGKNFTRADRIGFGGEHDTSAHGYSGMRTGGI